MNEFNNRIAAQREILTSINSKQWQEELFGLSHGALERWFFVNKISANSTLGELLLEAAKKLFFLANKSQEQITEEYKALSLEVGRITSLINLEINNIAVKNY